MTGRIPYLVEVWEERTFAAHPALRDAVDEAVARCDALTARLLIGEDDWDEAGEDRFERELLRVRLDGLRAYAELVRGTLPDDAQARWVRLMAIGGVDPDEVHRGYPLGAEWAVVGSVTLWAATELEALPSQRYDLAADPCTCGLVASGRLPKQLCGRCGVAQAQAWIAEERRLLDLRTPYTVAVDAVVDACVGAAAQLTRADEHAFALPLEAAQRDAAGALRGVRSAHRRDAKALPADRWASLANVVARHFSPQLRTWARRASKHGVGIAHVAMLSEWYDDHRVTRLRALAAADLDRLLAHDLSAS